MLFDAYNRRITDLRISLTERCNFRCFYCRPVCGPAISEKGSILSFEEIAQVSSVFVSLGIEKIRLTGGEPLIRKGLEDLVARLSTLKQKQRGNFKLRDLAITTNGCGLASRARSLKEAGLDRVTVSLDTLDRNNFCRITGADKLHDVIDGIKAARAAGLDPVKINAVIVRGWNEDEVVDLAGFARETGVSVRFIEFMPLDAGNSWERRDVVTGAEILQAVQDKYPLVPKAVRRGNETAQKFAFADGAPGEIGVITPVSEPFCGACSRIRLTANGQIRTCLFSRREYDLRGRLRLGDGPDDLARFIRASVFRKEQGHLIDTAAFAPASRSMSSIGG